MKRVIFFIVVLFLLLIVGVFFYQTHTSTTPISLPSSTPPLSEVQPALSPTINQQTFCLPSALQAEITTDPAAGNIYGSLTIKNISDKPCQITGNNFIQPTYTATNITISQQTPIGPATLLLPPGQTVYSRVHYPNGPQCQGPIKIGTISFHYQISPIDTLVFKNQNGDSNEQITLCASSQPTDVQVWSITDQPTNQ